MGCAGWCMHYDPADPSTRFFLMCAYSSSVESFSEPHIIGIFALFQFT